ncbi:hypothetical protein HID58_069989, partial [Brassica napus]
VLLSSLIARKAEGLLTWRLLFSLPHGLHISNINLSGAGCLNDSSSKLTESVSFQRILYFDQAVGGVSSSTVAIDSELKGNEELVWEPVSNKNSQSELGTLQELFLPEDVNSDLAIGQIINANATFSLLEGIFKHQALFYNSQTQFMPRPAVVNKLVKLGTVTLGSSYHYPLKSGFRNSKYDLDTRVSFKYSVSRGVSSTPTFYVNVFELLDAVLFLQLNEKIVKEVYAQQKEVGDEENAENIPVSTFFTARVGRCYW